MSFSQRHPLLAWSAVAAVLLAALALRTWNLDGPALWEDDFLSLDRAQMPLVQMFEVQKRQGPADTVFDLQPPLYYAVVHLALAIHDSSLAARIPGVMAGVLATLGMFLLGRTLFSFSTGLIAALLFAGLLYPIGFAQSIKHYALFQCLTIYSTYFLTQALAANTRRAWAAYVLCALGMLYSGYQGAPTLAAQAIWGLWFCLGRRPDDPPARRARRLKSFLAAMGLTGLCYLPWVPGVVFIKGFLANPAVDIWAGLDLAFVDKILSGFVARREDVAPWALLLWGGAFLLGVAAALWRRQGGALFLLLLWAGIGFAAFIFNQSEFRTTIHPRHMAAVFPVWALLAACGADWLCRGVGGLAPEGLFRAAARAVACALAVAALLAQSAEGYQSHYHGRMSYDRDLFRWLAMRKNNVEAMAFTGSKQHLKNMSMRWHLGGLFQPAGSWAQPAYRRMYVVDTFYRDAAGKRPAVPALPVKSFEYMHLNTDVWLAGLANRAPVAIAPDDQGRFAYEEDFKTFRFYEDCLASDNMILDAERAMVRPLRYSRPASLTYAFSLPEGAGLAAARAEVTWGVFHRHPGTAADSSFTVELSDNGQDFAPAAILKQRTPGRADNGPCAFFDEVDFYDSHCEKQTVSIDVDPRLLAAKRLYVRVSYTPGTTEGYLFVGGIKLEAAVHATDPARARAAALELEADTLLHNCRATLWKHGQTLAGAGVHAFAGPGFDHLAAGRPNVNTQADLQAFLAANPGIRPVRTLAGPDGQTALALYDPGLARPGLELAPARPEGFVRPAGGAPMPLASLTLSGDINSPTLLLGEERLDIPVIAPFGSTLTINPGRDARITFVPDWTAPKRMERAFFHADNIIASRRLRDEVTCGPAEACSFSYILVSALPIKSLRLIVMPDVYKNPCRKCEPNQVKVSVSTDGGATYRELASHQGFEECEWSRPGYAQAREVRFDKRTTSCIVLFELKAHEEAGFISPRDNLDGMYIQADLDAAIVPLLTLDPKGRRVALADGQTAGLELILADKPTPLPGRIWP